MYTYTHACLYANIQRYMHAYVHTYARTYAHTAPYLGSGDWWSCCGVIQRRYSWVFHADRFLSIRVAISFCLMRYPFAWRYNKCGFERPWLVISGILWHPISVIPYVKKKKSIHACIQICIYIHIHTRTYTYIHIHTYIHTDRQTDIHTYIACLAAVPSCLPPCCLRSLGGGGLVGVLGGAGETHAGARPLR